jgi:hypothetical protein
MIEGFTLMTGDLIIQISEFRFGSKRTPVNFGFALIKEEAFWDEVDLLNGIIEGIPIVPEDATGTADFGDGADVDCFAKTEVVESGFIRNVEEDGVVDTEVDAVDVLDQDGRVNGEGVVVVHVVLHTFDYFWDEVIK